MLSLLIIVQTHASASVSADVAQIVADAAKLNVGTIRPKITAEAIQSLVPPNGERLKGSFSAQRSELIDGMRDRVRPKTDEEYIERSLAQKNHEKLAMKTITGYRFKANGLSAFLLCTCSNSVDFMATLLLSAWNSDNSSGPCGSLASRVS
eukprot:SAG31_NODE_556_length_14161_cov_3.384943_2_plen_151_part_00